MTAALLVIGCALAAISAVGVASGDINIRYIDTRDGSRDEFHIGLQGTGTFGWWHYISKATLKREGLWEDFVSDELHNCSDEVHQCLTGSVIVFAVPRAGLASESTYTAGGAHLKVEKCLREQRGRCTRALVSSDCRWMAWPDRCSDTQSETTKLGGGPVKLGRGPVAYFIFDENKGVMSWGSVNVAAEGVEAQTEVAGQWRLKGSKGLFAAGTAIPIS